eukprot:CAMPEP_0174959646 /NCGR_PEP_ID=MMETSP0004_2-20121128/3291_1 /TAXON_ID=420556 /ORGANISM="Ochromonas sp., Strain CCMP1393" /LENGTH=79 /DNA_ID=CAMNT_0016207985 /DNA_START=377 /DNA_END=613 /DNA_ORIENTATION=+
MYHDDIVMAAHVIAMGLHRIWLVSEWDQEIWSPLTEAIADGAFAKMEKELEDGLTKEEFIRWATERFKESRSVASPEAL